MSGSKKLFRNLPMVSFSVHFISFEKRKAIKQRNCKGHEKRNRHLFSKVDFDLQVYSGMKILYIDPLFSNWVNFIKKCQA